MVATLAQRTRQDVRDFFSWSALALVATAAFTPVALLANALGIGLIALLAYRMGDESRVDSRHLGVAVALQALVYVGFGQALAPAGTFSDWLPAHLLTPATVYLYPLACTAAGVAAMWQYRRGGAGPLASYLAFALVSAWTALLVLFYYFLPRI